VLKPGAQALHLQTIFQRNYPLFDVAFARGLAGNLELVGHGLFHHAKIETTFNGVREVYRYDFDEFQGGVRWGILQRRSSMVRASAAAGVSRFYTRLKFSDGRYLFSEQRYTWANTTVSVDGRNGSRLIVAVKGLREKETGHDIVAAAASLELARIFGITPVGDLAMFIKNPGQWRRPWAAGGRLPMGRHWLVVYVSNTWGTTAPDSLFGTTSKFLNVRVHMVF